MAVFVRGLIWRRAALALENVALRQQLNVLRRSVPRPRLTDDDRLFWLVLKCLHAGWAGLVQVVSPGTVLRWHKAGWRKYWGWRCHRRRQPGRPPIGWALVRLIRRLSRENSTWGARRIHDELELLGHKVGVETVRRYMLRPATPGGQHWKTFLKNHLNVTAACDFFTVPTATFRSLFVLVVLSHDRRLIRRVAVTAHPTAAWTAAQVAAAFPAAERPAYLVHDRQTMFKSVTFRRQLEALAIEDRRTAPRQCWQNAYCERVIGTLRRECTDHVIAFNARHLERILREYVEQYYNPSRPHMSLERNSPIPRTRDATPATDAIATPVLGGLHHTYRRAA